MRLLRIKSLSCTLIMMTSAQVSFAATYHVSPFGSNTPPYDTYAKAAHEVADAADLAVAVGDTVLVHAGNYTSTDTVNIALGVIFAGVGRDSVIIDWGDTEHQPGRLVSVAGLNDIYGMHFRYPPGSSFSDQITLLHAYTGQHIKLHDCRFTEAGVYLDGDTWLPGDGVIEVYGNHFDFGGIPGLFAGSPRCFIHDNLFTVSGADASGMGIRAWLADAVIVENNQFLADVDLYDNPFAITIDQCDTAFVRNNLIRNSQVPITWIETNGTIENNTMIHSDPNWYASVAIFQGSDDHVTIRNNVFVDMERPIAWGPYDYLSPDTAGVTTFIHNQFWPPRDTLYKMYPAGVSPSRFPVIESLNVFAYPMFADESTYSPQAGSPLINSGDPLLTDVDLTRSDIGWHGGPGGFICANPQLPPQPPESLWVAGSGGIVMLAWSSRPEADLAEYRLYRGTASGFWDSGTLPYRTLSKNDTVTVDTLLVAGDSYFYVVTAVDTAGMESVPSPEGMFVVSGVLDDDASMDVPRTPDIVRVYPNPFNSGTVIEIQTPEGHPHSGEWTINIYDILGRRIATLRDDWSESSRQSIEWDGRDSNGRILASGVYFARMQVSGQIVGKTASLVIVR